MVSKLRACFISITFDPEPGAIRGLPLARRLVDSGRYEVTAITAIPWYPLGRFYDGYRLRLYQWELCDGVRILRLPVYPSHDRSAVRRIATYLSFAVSAVLLSSLLVDEQDVVFHADNLPTTGLVSLFLGFLWKAPTVQHVGDLWPESMLSSGIVRDGWLSRLMGRSVALIQRFIYSRNVIITVLSDGFRQNLLSRGVDEAKLLTLPNWADEDRFTPVLASSGAAARLGIADRFNIVFAGNVGPLQGLSVVIEAAGLISDLNQVQFVIVGDGPDLSTIVGEARARQLKNVVFLGRLPIDEMPTLNAVADAMLIHLKDEAFLHTTVPSKTQVALYAGRPILMGARGDAASIVQEAGAGIVFEPDNAESLAAAVRELFGMSVETRRSMGEAGAAYYAKHLSLAAGVNVMDGVFRLASERV